ncbi:MAG: SRPBCC domain-containing protein [Acidimicrobiales bacterium]
MEITDDVRSRMGTATVTDGIWTLSYVRHLAHPPEKVWRAITESEHIAAWFPADIVGERRAGADVDMPFWPDIAERFEVAEPDTHGHIEVWDPPTRFELLWEDERLRWVLEPTTAGTTLSLTVVVQDATIATDAAAGYHVCLDRLEHLLDTAEELPLIDHPTALAAAYANG